MSDQGFGIQKQWSTDQVTKVAARAVPIGPVALTTAQVVIATAPPQQIMQVEHLAVCNPTTEAVNLTVTAAVNGTSFVQIPAMPVEPNTAVDITKLIGGLYRTGSTLSASGAGLIVSGRYGAVL